MFEGQTITWAALWQRVEDLSYYFAERLGANDQQIVATLLTNSIDFIEVYLAALRAGHMVLPLDPAYKRLEIDAIIGQLKPRLIITSPRYRDSIAQTTKVILVSDLPVGNQKQKRLRRPAKDQIASLTFTSGTSGQPKTVPNTHANHLWNIKACSQRWRWNSNDSLLITLPLSHMHGLVIGLSGAIFHGNTLYLKQQSFDAEQTLSDLASGRISMFTHVPLAYAKMLEAPGNKTYDLAKVRVCISGAAPLSPAVWRQFKDRFGIEIIETYGSSETGRIAGNRLDKKVVGSPGPPFDGVQVRLSADGELEVKSPGLFPGYFGNPTATKKGLADGGYWRTGDLAELKDGNIILKGRLQERIRRFGYTISPRDVEWAMLQNPAVKDILVIGQQRPAEPNDELIYFIVSQLSDGQIEAYCKQNLLFSWRPDRIIHLDGLPRNRSGKPRLKALQELANV